MPHNRTVNQSDRLSGFQAPFVLGANADIEERAGVLLEVVYENIVGRLRGYKSTNPIPCLHWTVTLGLFAD